MIPSTGNDGQPPSLEELDARLKKARGARHADGGSKPPVPRLAKALGVAVEMAAGVAVGGIVGWLLDSWLNTRPWLLVVFFMLGIAAGVLNAYRASKRIAAEAEKESESAGDDEPPAGA